MAGPWEDFVQAHRKVATARGRWTLCVKANVLVPGELLNDREYQKLATGGDWGVEVLGAAQAQDLQSSQGAQWALLAPSGDVAGTGPGRPQGAALLDAIHASGSRPRFEVREAFLKDHPGQGEARLEELGQELRLLRARVAGLDAQGKVRVPAWHPEAGTPAGEDRITLAGAEGDAKADELYQGVQEALLSLTQVPAWTREAQWVASRLALFGLGQSTSMKRLFGSLLPALEEEAAADPEDPGLIQLWVEVLDGATMSPEALSGRFLPVPGSVWPNAQILPSLLEPFRRRQDWEGELKLLSDLAPQAPPEPVTQRGWDEYCELQATLLASTTSALASRGSWEQARASLDEALKWGGGRSVQAALLRRGTLAPGADTAAWRGLFTQLAQRNTARPPAPPLPPPLRLTLMGRPAWLMAWAALRDAPDLASWSPAELRWEIANTEAHTKARARYGWSAHPRWVLTQGDDLLATGEIRPEAKGLAAILAGHGMPMLDRMALALAQNPGHLGLRRARFDLLLRRMPDPRLEPLLAEDATRARLVLPFTPKEDWKPDEALWGGAAQAVLPELENQLRSWPADAELWRTWIAWSRFHPGRPFLLDLARSLPFWNPAGDWRTLLPYDVQRAVAAELSRQGNFQIMRDWFQASWDLMDHRPLKDLRPWERQYYTDLRREEDTAVFRPLRDALKALGMNEQLLDLERTFGAMMGRDTTRSR